MNSIKKNFIYNISYQMFIILVSLVTTPYISRVLGSNGIGQFSYANSIAYYFVMFIMLGLNNYGNRAIAKSRNQIENLSKTFWSIYFMQLAVGCIVVVLYFGYTFFISNDFLISICLSFYVISAVFDINWFFYGMEEFKIAVKRSFIIKVATTLMIFTFVRNNEDVLAYSLIISMSFLFSSIILWPYLFKRVKFHFPKKNEILCHIKPNLLLFITVISVSLFKTFDKIMLGILSSNTELGYYELSERIIAIPIVGVTALGTVMLPRMTNLIATKSNKASDLIEKSIIMSMFLSSSVSFGIMAVSKEFVPLFFGEGYEACVSIFLVLLPSCLFLAFANVIRTQFLLPNNMDRVYISSAIIGAAVNILLNLLLIFNYGALGTAIATLVAEAMVCIYQVSQTRNQLPIKKYIVLSFPFFISGLLMFLIVYNITLSTFPLLILIIIKVIAGVLVYFVTLILNIYLFTRLGIINYHFNVKQIFK